MLFTTSNSLDNYRKKEEKLSNYKQRHNIHAKV